MDREEGTQKESLWGDLAFAAIMCLVISAPVLGLLYLAEHPATWVMLAVVAVIAVVLLATVLVARLEIDEDEDMDDGPSWADQHPSGAKQWLKFTGHALLAWVGIGFLVNKMILDWLLGASDATLGISALVLLPLAFLGEWYLGDAPQESASEPGPEHPDERPGLVDA